MKLPFKGARLLKPNEVPQPGDFARWSDSLRDSWVEISSGNTRLHGLPVATIRTRCGQDAMQFCTGRRDLRKQSVFLSASNVEAIMSGAIAAFASGDDVTLKYSDGTSERAKLPEIANAIRHYAEDTRRDAPNFFSIVSAVQAQRTA